MTGFMGNTILGLDHDFTPKMTGSGDQLYDWVYTLNILVLSILGTIVWSILDHRRTQYEKLQQWFLLFVTYYLAYYMLVYGIIKIFYLQFRPPGLERLFQNFGQISPMRLMWMFMGYSKSYTMFAGMSETLAGILLLIPRTRTLGGLVGAGVMLNVFMMNMSYDIPVKLFSFQLMIMGLYIAMMDWRRLLNVFILNKPVPASETKPLIAHKIGKRVLLGVQLILVAYFFFSNITSSVSSRAQYGEGREKPPLYGVYEVESFVRNQDTISPMATDSTRWEYMLIDYPRFTSVLMMDEKLQRYTSKIDTIEQTFTFTISPDTVNKYVLQYVRDEEFMTLEGELEGDTLQIQFVNIPLENFGLYNRGFNWVNEVPYNRYKPSLRD